MRAHTRTGPTVTGSIARLLFALALPALAGCDAVFGPKTYEEAMKAAGAAYRAKDAKKAYAACARALELADKVGNGYKAINALDCLGEAAFRLGDPARALPAYAQVIGTYEGMLKGTASRFRIRNNHGVALHQAGRTPEALRALEEALDAWAGTPYATTAYGAFTPRMRIVANLARVAMQSPEAAVAARLTGEIGDEILEKAAGNANAVQFLIGASEALEALSALARRRGEVARAEELAATAAELGPAEAEILLQAPGLKRAYCDQFGAMDGAAEGCMREIR